MLSNLSIYTILYDIDFIIIFFPYVKYPFLFNLSKCLCIFYFSIRFIAKLAPHIVIVSLCKLLNLSKGLYGGGVEKREKKTNFVFSFFQFFFFRPRPSDPERLLLPRDLKT